MGVLILNIGHVLYIVIFIFEDFFSILVCSLLLAYVWMYLF